MKLRQLDKWIKGFTSALLLCGTMIHPYAITPVFAEDNNSNTSATYTSIQSGNYTFAEQSTLFLKSSYDREHADEIYSEVTSISRELGLTDNLNDLAKIRLIHDWICENVSYNYSHYRNCAGSNRICDDYNEYHTAYGTLDNRSALCQGYMLLFDVMCQVNNIEVGCVINNAHCWNTVKYNGEWYFVDTTWDDKDGSYNWLTWEKEDYVYKYFMKGYDSFYSNGSHSVAVDYATDQAVKDVYNPFAAEDIDVDTIDMSSTTSVAATGSTDTTSPPRSGWYNNGTDWYFYDSEGVLLQASSVNEAYWLYNNGKWYALDSEGKMLTSQWVRWYDSNGNCTWYYVSQSGAMVTQQWLIRDGKDVYVGQNGQMLTERFIKSVDGYYYYVDENGIMVASDWVYYKDGNAYYMNAKGRMLANQWKVIDGSLWFFNASGVGKAVSGSATVVEPD